jgi:hypothetical protein
MTQIQPSRGGRAPTPASAVLPGITYRRTGLGVYQATLGDVYLGTIQKFTPHEWWAYPPTGDPSATLTSRDSAGHALLAALVDAAAAQLLTNPDPTR